MSDFEKAVEMSMAGYIESGHAQINKNESRCRSLDSQASRYEDNSSNSYYQTSLSDYPSENSHSNDIPYQRCAKTRDMSLSSTESVDSKTRFQLHRLEDIAQHGHDDGYIDPSGSDDTLTSQMTSQMTPHLSDQPEDEVFVTVHDDASYLDDDEHASYVDKGGHGYCINSNEDSYDTNSCDSEPRSYDKEPRSYDSGSRSFDADPRTYDTGPPRDMTSSKSNDSSSWTSVASRPWSGDSVHSDVRECGDVEGGCTEDRRGVYRPSSGSSCGGYGPGSPGREEIKDRVSR